METANQNCKDSMIDGNPCKGLSESPLATSTVPGSAPDCKTGEEPGCPCSCLDRLEADLGINEGATNRMFASQVAEDITPAEAAALIETGRGKGSLAILDVSTREEFLNWHIEDAFNINIFSLNFSERLNKLDKEKTYLVYCKMGVRSAAAQKVMMKQGFREVFNIVGGRDRWKIENIPHGSGPAK